MPKPVIYTKGQILGNNIIFIREVERVNPKLPRASFVCHCGKQFEANITTVKSKNKKSCGCMSTSEAFAILGTKHGLYDHILYKRWISMKHRCHNPNASNYHKYGARQIFVCEEWKNDFLSFYNFIITLKGYDEEKMLNNKISIDRIDNNVGYKPSNVRIVDWHVQNTNKRTQKNNKTGMSGISKNKNKWYARITVYGVRTTLGSFLTKEEAIKCRLEYVKNNNLMEYFRYI